MPNPMPFSEPARSYSTPPVMSRARLLYASACVSAASFTPLCAASRSGRAASASRFRSSSVTVYLA